MPSLTGPNALLFLQLLISLVTMSAVKVSAISIGFLLVTNRVSLEEECLPSLEVLNCLLNLAASCLDDENEIPLKIALFSAVRFCFAVNSFDSSSQLGNIYLIVHVLNKISPFFCGLCSQMRFWMFLFRRVAISYSEVVSSGHHVQYLCWCRFLVEPVSSSRDMVRRCFE